MKLIIDATSGTIVDADNCYVVDTEQLSDIENDELENGSDEDIAHVAKTSGIPLKKIGSDTGWGDNAYRYTVSYSPLSIKDEADALLDGGIYQSPEDDRYLKALEWARDEATLEQLTAVSDLSMSYDAMWDGFRENLMDSLMTVYKELHP